MATTAGPAVAVESVSRTFGQRLALDSVSLTVAPGELFALLGPNGGGKTTLFRILATLIPPSGGTFRVDGLAPGGGLGPLRQRLGVVFQSPSLDRQLTVAENLLFSAEVFGVPRAAARARSAALLARFGVADRARDLAGTLSGGLLRRVEIAKALLHEPRVLLLDEPSTGLDPLARRTLRDVLADLARRDGTTVLLTTHLFEEAEAADRIGILDRGRLVALGAPEELKRQVGGDVLVLVAASPAEAAALAGVVAALLGAEAGTPAVVDATVRLERPDAPSLVPRLSAALGSRIRSITVGRPSLEDVFVARTGHRFEEAAA